MKVNWFWGGENKTNGKEKKKSCRNNLIKWFKNSDLNIKMVKLDLNEKKNNNIEKVKNKIPRNKNKWIVGKRKRK